VGNLAQLGASPARLFAGYAPLYGLMKSDTILTTGKALSSQLFKLN
jgi:hypothetical protein